MLVVAGCAPRQAGPAAAPAPAPSAPVLDVDALLSAGCYRCLEAAFATLQEQPRTSTAQDREAAFQLAALLALRAKEIGVPYAPWVARATEVLPPGDEWALYVDIVN